MNTSKENLFCQLTSLNVISLSPVRSLSCSPNHLNILFPGFQPNPLSKFGRRLQYPQLWSLSNNKKIQLLLFMWMENTFSKINKKIIAMQGYSAVGLPLEFVICALGSNKRSLTFTRMSAWHSLYNKFSCIFKGAFLWDDFCWNKIIDPRSHGSWCIVQRTDQSPKGKDSTVPLMHHNQSISVLGALIQTNPKECTQWHYSQ